MAFIQPTFVQEAETVWNTTTTPKDTASFAVLNGDLLVALMVGADSSGFTLSVPATLSGSTSAWTAIASSPVAPGSKTPIGMWWATATADGNVTVRFARGGGTPQLFGGNVLTFRDHGGIGASPAAVQGNPAAPSVDITTVQDHSAIVFINGDWASVTGTQTARVNAGAATTASALPGDGATYAVFGAYHEDAGPAARYAVGMTAPATQNYNLMAVEVKGSFMPWKSGDRVKETSTTTGTGDLTLAGAVAGFQAFSSICANLDLVKYALVHQTPGEWETGWGKWKTGNLLERLRVYESSNANALVSFSAGTKDVWVNYPGRDGLGLAASKIMSIDTWVPDDTSLVVGAELRITAELELGVRAELVIL